MLSLSVSLAVLVVVLQVVAVDFHHPVPLLSVDAGGLSNRSGDTAPGSMARKFQRRVCGCEIKGMT